MVILLHEKIIERAHDLYVFLCAIVPLDILLRYMFSRIDELFLTADECVKELRLLRIH